LKQQKKQAAAAERRARAAGLWVEPVTGLPEGENGDGDGATD
jgi:hypothetical protein